MDQLSLDLEPAPTHYVLPTKPYSAIDAINRVAAATGSIRYAMAAEGADYNGNHASLVWNDYRQGWQGYFTWAGLHYIINASERTSTEDALQRMRAWYDREGRGGSVSASFGNAPAEKKAEFRALASKYGFILPGEEDTSWVTWLHGAVTDVIWYDKNMGVPVKLALESSSLEEWKAKRDALLAGRRAERQAYLDKLEG